ncbi:hypothetical protein HMPREF1982_02643 [Clostridiales bacterium oral taxon 876 str. F0540]|nr:hypothetical protein HMPREF1982_02643 [Clostridiales bacterium oral taxon 876 str. F0540]
MKLIIDKKIRSGLLFVLSFLIIFICFLLFKGIKYPGFKEDKKLLYNYNNIANIDYKAILKPNTLYGDNASLGDGSIIISEFLDSIKANFKYQFNGERSADIKGDYEIVALLEGTVGSDKDQKILWQKTFPISQKQSFELKDKSVAIEKEVQIKPEEYKAFAQSFASASKVDAQVKLSVVMNINLKAVTDKGVIDKKLSPTMIIPINSNYFEVTKKLGDNKPEAIQKTEKIQLPVSKRNIIFYSVILLILILALVYTILFVQGAENNNPKEKELQKIFKNHGDRMVALSDIVTFNSEYYYKVWSIEDLVKVSDEISRPVMYKFSTDVNEINEFYVCDDRAIYIFFVNKKIEQYKDSKLNNENSMQA